MTTILYIEDVESRFIVKQETEKAYLLQSTSRGNHDCWFPKSGFSQAKKWDNSSYDDTKLNDDSIIKNLVIKDWLWDKLNPSQEALLNSAKIA